MSEDIIILEYHPHDSRIGIPYDQVFQSLTQIMGTGGNNVPLVLERVKYESVKQKEAIKE